MQRKPGFPVANCSIKMPENMSSMSPESFQGEDDVEQQHRRQQLINFGHSQWGFNNWSWTVTKQELDFVDLTNGKYTAGVVAFVSVVVKSFDIHRENIGYATSVATSKGFAIYKSRKCAVTNALRETLLSFGGSVATDLLDLLETHKPDLPTPAPAPASAPIPVSAPVPVAPVPVAPVVIPTPAPLHPEPANENNQNIPNKTEPKNSPLNRNLRKDSDPAANMRSPHPAPLKPVAPVAKAHPMPAALPPAPRMPRPPAPPAPAPPHLRPNSNEPLGDADEEARAERKRRQRQAQEEFRQRQLLKQKGTDERHELSRHGSSFDRLLLALPSQDVEIEQTAEPAPEGKRPSPAHDGQTKRRAGVSRLDIVQAD